MGKEKPTLKQIRQQKLSYLQSSSCSTWWAIRDSQGATATEQRACARASRNSSSPIAMPRRTSHKATSRMPSLPPKKTAYTAEHPKSFKTFWEKEKPTLKQIRQLSLSYLQNSSCFDVVGNKGLEPLTFSTSRRHSPN